MKRPRYRRSHIGYKFRFGPRAQDEIKGFQTNEKRLKEDDFGNRIDPRFGRPDIDWKSR